HNAEGSGCFDMADGTARPRNRDSGPAQSEDVNTYIRQRLASEPLASRLAANGRATDYVARILWEKSDGLFLVARHTLNGIEREVSSLDSLDELAPGLFGLYKSYFDRYFGDGASRPESGQAPSLCAEKIRLRPVVRRTTRSRNGLAGS